MKTDHKTTIPFVIPANHFMLSLMQLDLMDPTWDPHWNNGSHNRVCHCFGCLSEIAAQAIKQGEPHHWDHEMHDQKHKRRSQKKHL